jgi:hypothetical protein
MALIPLLLKHIQELELQVQELSMRNQMLESHEEKINELYALMDKVMRMKPSRE